MLTQTLNLTRLGDCLICFTLDRIIKCYNRIKKRVSRWMRSELKVQSTLENDRGQAFQLCSFKKTKTKHFLLKIFFVYNPTLKRLISASCLKRVHHLDLPRNLEGEKQKHKIGAHSDIS